MMLMTLSVTFPIIVSIGLDPIWFGVILVLLIEIGLVTPPVGIVLFVLKGMSPQDPVRDIVYGVTPFILLMLGFIRPSVYLSGDRHLATEANRLRGPMQPGPVSGPLIDFVLASRWEALPSRRPTSGQAFDPEFLRRRARGKSRRRDRKGVRRARPFLRPSRKQLIGRADRPTSSMPPS